MPDTPARIDPRWAWQRYRPTRDNPWDVRKAGHLYRRAAFGANHNELQQAVRDGLDRTMDRILNGRDNQAGFERLSGTLASTIRAANNGPQATAWWLYKMLYTPHPLREKLTLFWHDHFATSNLKVNSTTYMLQQYGLLRQHAQGSFRTMLHGITLDPAMLVFLDTTQSRRGRPNENYARELMELFSLGIFDYRNPRQRNYTEQDIREAARAFTGYRIENNRGVFNAGLHDNTEKTVLGRTGRFRGPDIVNICLEKPTCAYFIAGKMFQFLISETIEPTPALIEPLATEFRREYNIGALVEKILRSNLFFSAQAYRTRVKSPVEFAIGIVRGLEGRVGTLQVGTALEGLGQRLFYPPSVAGWDEGRAWLNAQTLLFRHNLALAITSTQNGQYGRRCDPATVARTHNRQTDDQLVNFFLNVFLQGDVPAASRNRLTQYMGQARNERVPVFWTAEDAANQRVRSLCHLVLTLPEFQLS